MNDGEVNEDGQPLDQRTLTRLSRVCDLATQQRMSLTLQKFEDLAEDEKMSYSRTLFNDMLYIQKS
jgi:hypothetical protein